MDKCVYGAGERQEVSMVVKRINLSGEEDELVPYGVMGDTLPACHWKAKRIVPLNPSYFLVTCAKSNVCAHLNAGRWLMR